MPNDGMYAPPASSYSCPFGCQCGIVLSFVKVTVTPPAVSGLPGDTQQLLCVQEKDDCHGTAFYFDITGFATWLSGDPTVATINSTGFANAVGPGSTYLAAQFTDLEYYWDDFRSNCVERQRTEASSARCDVIAPTSLSLSIGSKITHNGDSAGVCPGPPGTCIPVCYGYERRLSYTVLDQNGRVISGTTMTATENVHFVSTSAPLIPPDFSITVSVGSDGKFGDALAFCFPQPPPPQSGEFLKAKQNISVTYRSTNYPVRTNCVDFESNDVTLTDVTSNPAATCQ